MTRPTKPADSAAEIETNGTHTNPSETGRPRPSQRAARALLPQSNARTRSTMTESHKEPTVRTKPSRAHMTVDEFCDEMGIVRSTFYEWRAKHRAPQCIKLPNGALRISREAYGNWLASLQEEVA